MLEAQRNSVELTSSRRSLHLARAVHNHRPKPGHTVSIFSRNSNWYPLCALDSIRAGGRTDRLLAAPIVDEIAYSLTLAKRWKVVRVSYS